MIALRTSLRPLLLLAALAAAAVPVVLATRSAEAPRVVHCR